MFDATMVEPLGPHHSFIRAGSVKHFHTSARGASNVRVMTKSLLCVSTTMNTPDQFAWAARGAGRDARSADTYAPSRAMVCTRPESAPYCLMTRLRSAA